MNKVDFYNILEGDQEANNQDILSLEAMLKTYPFFGLGQCMYLDALNKSGNTKYENELQIRAPFVNNRSLLHKVDSRSFILPKANVEELIDTEKSIETIEVTTENHVDKVDITSNESEPTNKKKSKKKDKKKKSKKKSSLENRASSDVVNELIQSESIGYQILNDLNTKAEESTITENTPEDLEVVIQPEYVPAPTNYLDWLKSKSQTTVVPKTVIPEVINPENGDNLLTVSDLVGKKTPKESKSEHDILKSFLSNKSSQREKIKTYDAHELVSKSIEDNSDMVTETLGRIYASQGLHNKAKQVYQKLILLNPEKSSYFADLIDKLDKN